MRAPGFDMDDFYDYASVAPQLLNNDDSESTVLVWPKMFYNMVTIPERRLRLLVVTGPAPSLCLRRFMTRFFKYVKNSTWTTQSSLGPSRIRWRTPARTRTR